MTLGIAEPTMNAPIDPVAGFAERGHAVVALRAEFPAGPAVPQHRHARAQLALLPDQVLRVRTGARLWIVPPGQALWLPPEVDHQSWSDGRRSMRSLYIRREAALGLPGAPRLVEVRPVLREIVCWLAETSCGGEASPTWRRLAEAALGLIHPLEADALPLPRLSSPKLRRIEARLRAEPGEERPMAAYAAEEGLSERGLLRLVARQTGLSWRRWRRLVVLSEGVPRLAAGMPVWRVAADLGFASASGFITAFQTVFGRTPGRFIARP